MKIHKYKKPELTLIDMPTKDIIQTSPICPDDQVCLDCPAVNGSLDLSSL